MSFPSDLEIARSATIRPLAEIADTAGIPREYLEPYGDGAAKIKLDAIEAMSDRPKARYVVVSAITPTPLGEGKTTTTVGLGQGFSHIGKKATIAIRQPSMGPTFGIKGGAAGGGYSQVVPMELFNLHLTGDMHAVTAAHNMCSAMLDAHLFHGNELGLDLHNITWRRVLDINERALRNIVVGMGGRLDGIPRETGFDITAASEVMAALALCTSLQDLRARMGRIVGPRVAERFGRCILELGGNNAGIVCPSADLDMALRAIAFGAMGTAGQRCTTMRRLFVHESIYDQIVPALKKAYASVSVGNPLETQALVGPLIDGTAFKAMQEALEEARALGGRVHGGARESVGPESAFYVKPALVEMPEQAGPVLRETFAPILYVMTYSDFDDVLEAHNAVGGGLSSSIFTTDLREMELFLSARGSDCGIANVNIGTSGAEIGGAFGGEKETGGGRESGSDAWRAYMRRATNTINYSRELPLAQGVVFDID